MYARHAQQVRSANLLQILIVETVSHGQGSLATWGSEESRRKEFGSRKTNHTPSCIIRASFCDKSMRITIMK